MGKVPIGLTLGETLSFAFGRYPALLGVVWLPLALLGLTYYFTFVPLFRELAQLAHEAAQHPAAKVVPPDMSGFGGMAPVANLVALVTSVWLNAGVTKAALGLPRSFPFAYVAIGWDELRLFAANLVIMAFLYGGIIAVALVAIGAVSIGGALVSGGVFTQSQIESLRPWLLGSSIACGIALVFAFIYFLIRLMFFLAPVTIVEKRFGLWRSWELSKGNFWRIFTVEVAIFLLMLALELASVALFVIPAIVASGGVHAREPAVWFKSLLPFASVGALLFPILPVVFGLQFAPSAFAYRSMRRNMEAMAGSS